MDSAVSLGFPRSHHPRLTRRTRRTRFETLESRVLLCGDPLSHPAPEGEMKAAYEVLARHDADGDGHVTRAQFDAMPADEQARLDPHMIEEVYDGPIDFDEILGVPLFTDPEAARGGPEADALPDWFPAVNGSITLDQTSQAGRVLVKFPTAINNQGAGPGIGVSGRPGIDPIPTGAPISSWLRSDGSQAVLQAVYSFNGSSFTLSHYRDAGAFTYHAGHSHFHFDGYNNYRLRARNTDGTPGPYVQRPDGTGIVGEKIGFCLINVLGSFVTEGGQSSTSLPGYNAPGQPSTGCGFVQGVHVGEADQYGSGTSGQWLDVTGVPNGNYFLEITVDGENMMAETNETNNTKTFPFTLNVNPPPGGITRDEFDQVGNNNDTAATATNMNVMGTFIKTGLTIHWGQDHDWFRFVASSSGTYTVTSTQANGNVDLYLYDANVTQIGASTNQGGAESISYNFVEGRTYYVKAQTYNSATSSNYQVAWNLKPLATSTSSAAVASEAGAVGKFRVARNGPLEQPLTVNFTLGGTATNGVDYQLVSGPATMGNLDSFIEIEIVPINDRLVEGRETVTLTVTSGSAYVVGATGSTVVIVDNDLDRGALRPFLPAMLPAAPTFGGSRLIGDESSEDDAITTLLA